jgi:four helix bundle protein
LGAIRDYRDLAIWQRAMDLAQRTYDLSASFPASEQYGLTSQLRRSAVSVPSNIAEGHGRESDGDFARFLRIARGSLAEMQTQILLAERLDYCSESSTRTLHDSIEELGRMLRGMQKSVAANMADAKD